MRNKKEKADENVVETTYNAYIAKYDRDALDKEKVLIIDLKWLGTAAGKPAVVFVS